MRNQYIREVVNFISDLRNLPTEHEKDYRIKEEIAKIRINFSSGKATDQDKRKNLLKLLYIQMLGYYIDLGHLESVQLLASDRYFDKATGYMGCEMLLGDYQELYCLCINTTLEDLNSPLEHICSLALTFVANSHCIEMNERLSNEIIKMTSKLPVGNDYLRKKIYMCLLKTYKLNPQLYNINEWYTMALQLLNSEKDIYCILSICNLLVPLLEQLPKNWEESVNHLVNVLWNVVNDNVSSEYSYYNITAPWLIIKILSLLSTVPKNKDASCLSILTSCFKTLLERMGSIGSTSMVAKEQNRVVRLMNLSIYMIKTAILRECIRAIVNWYACLPSISASVVCDSIRHLYSSQMPQIRLVSLEILEDIIKVPDMFKIVKDDVEVVIQLLNDSDPAIKRREQGKRAFGEAIHNTIPLKTCFVTYVNFISHVQSAKILHKMCDQYNWEVVIPELLSTVRYSELSLQDYIIPLMCDCIDKVATKNSLYIDIFFKIVIYAPLAHINSIFSTLVSTLYKDNTSKFQATVVNKCIEYLLDENLDINDSLLRYVNDYRSDRYFSLGPRLYWRLTQHTLPLVNFRTLGELEDVSSFLFRICAYVMGEYGHLSDEMSLSQQIHLLEKYYVIATPECKGIIITAYNKMAHHDNSVLKSVQHILDKYMTCSDVDLQIRICEALKMIRIDPNLFNHVHAISSRKKKEENDSESDSRAKHSRKLKREGHRDGKRDKDHLSPVVKPLPPRDYQSPRRGRDQSPPRSTYPFRDTPISPRMAALSIRDNQEPHRMIVSDNRGIRDVASPRDAFKEVTLDKSPLLDNKNCIAYRDENLFLELTQAYKGQYAKILVRICANSRSIKIKRCKLDSPDGISGEVHNELDGTVLRQREDVGHKLSFTLMNETILMPQYHLEYSVQESGIKRVTIDLPVVLHKFLSPAPIDNDRFNSMWNSLGNSATDTFKYFDDIQLLCKDIELSLNLNCKIIKTNNEVKAYACASGIKGQRNQQIVVMAIFSYQKAESSLLVSFRCTSLAAAQCSMSSLKLLLSARQ